MTRFRERLVPGAGTLIALLLLAPATWIVCLPLSPTVGVILAIAITVAAEAIIVLTAPVVEVTDGTLVAGRARIPVALTATTEGFRGEEATAERGTRLDARAFTLFRGWVDPVLRIELNDQDDPAPYWLVSTRRPEELQAALVAERASTAAERPADG